MTSPGFSGSAGGRHRLPASHPTSRTACPRAANRARATAKSSTPGRAPVELSSDKATTSSSGSPASAAICSISRASVCPGPTSRNVRAPAAYIARTSDTNSTGCANWFPSRSRVASASAGYAPPVVLAYTGVPAGRISTAASVWRNGPAASATCGLWKAAGTASGTVRTAIAWNARSVLAISSDGPESTTWAGAFLFANTTAAPVSTTTAWARASGARTASMRPGSPGRALAMSRPRSRERMNSSPIPIRPPAARAGSSP